MNLIYSNIFIKGESIIFLIFKLKIVMFNKQIQKNCQYIYIFEFNIIHLRNQIVN